MHYIIWNKIARTIFKKSWPGQFLIHGRGGFDVSPISSTGDRNVDIKYILFSPLSLRHQCRTVMLRLHYVHGGHGNHGSGHREENGMNVRQRRGTG